MLRTGLYCKWLIQAAAVGVDVTSHSLTMTFVGSYVTLKSQDCDFDGFVVYAGNSTSARKIGNMD
jgi:hypothetical protein